MSKLWNNLQFVTQHKDLSDFKHELKNHLKLLKIKHFSSGSKLGNTLLNWLRVGRYDLNLHKFTIGLPEKPKCDCPFRNESPENFILDLFLYTPERQTLFNLVEHLIPKFSKLNKSEKNEVLISGLNMTKTLSAK